MGFYPKSQTRPLFLYFKGWEYKLCKDDPSPSFMGIYYLFAEP